MTHISQLLRRMALCLAVLLCVCVNAAAQTKPTEGTGTADDPYKVYTLAHLKWIASNAGGRWKSQANGGDGHYIQMDDIDCNNESLAQPIGNSSIPFTGVYDGNGFSIKNLNISWKKSPIIAGLFGYVNGGTLRNIVIENATMEITEVLNTSDFKVGILAAAISPNTATTPATDVVVENIMIKNSRIVDGGFDNNGEDDKGLAHGFIGGVVGDVTMGYAQTLPIKGGVTMSNIYADVNIDLANVEPADAQCFQFVIGGIVGRIRTGKKGHLPTNTFFKGDIKAPKAMIGPVFASVRVAEGNKGDFMAEHYAGQVVKEDNVDYATAPTEYDFLNLSEFNTNHYYNGYRVYDSGASDYVDAHSITTGYDVTHGGVTISLKTLSDTKPLNSWSNAAIKANMRSYQGVNNGTYVAPADVATTIDALSVTDFLWVATPVNVYMRDKEVSWLSIAQNDITFSATLKDKDGNAVSTEGKKIKWYSVDENNREQYLGESPGNASASSEYNSLFMSDGVLKAVLCDEEGNEVKDKGHSVFGYCKAVKNLSDEDINITVTANAASNTFSVAIAKAEGVTFSIEHKYTESDDVIDTYTDASFTLPMLTAPSYFALHIDKGGATGTQTVPLDYVAKVEAILLSDGQLPSLTSKRYNQKGEELSAPDGLTNGWITNLFNGAEISADGTTINVKDVSTIDRGMVATCKDARGNVIQSMPAVVKKVNLNLSQDGYIITATLDGYDASLGSWSWRGISGDILGTEDEGYDLGNSTNELTINSTNDKYNVYRVTWTSTDGFSVLHGYISASLIVYVYNKAVSDSFKSGKYVSALAAYPDGNDDNDGRTPRTAVKTMARAYQLLSADNKAANNVIVVMGYLADEDFLKQKNNPGESGSTVQLMPSDAYKKNATITGSYGEITKEGTLMLNGADDTRGINGATIFKNITLNGLLYEKGANTTASHMLFYCNLNDLTIGNNVKVEDYKDMVATNGLLTTNAPHITIVGAFHQYGNAEFEYPSGNAVPEQTTLIFQSGNWGRIIASGRNNGLNTKSNNVFGHPDNPHRVAVNVAIKHTKDSQGKDNKYDYCPGKKYDYDIGLLVGGQTDGTIYVDANLYMSSGTVGRFISGNISYGRATGDGYPSDGFFGSTELTLDGGEIQELIGGTLGRHDCSSNGTEKCEAYFYGRSILNINGGTINDNIYAAGAGGVVGIGNDEYHTKDQNIPYLTGNVVNGKNEVRYGPYGPDENEATAGKMPTMALSDGTILKLGESYSIVNINGGTVKGNVYGGGYGYSKDIAVDKALDQAGDLFGQSYVTVNGGTINGNVYGGGAGASEYVFHQIAKKYYDYQFAYYQTAAGGNKNATQAKNAAIIDRDAVIDAHKYEWLDGIIAPEISKYVTKADIDYALNQFQDLANVYGDTHVSVKGGIIEGRIYAGSKGISGLPKMATLFGNTDLVIENVTESDNTVRVPIINGNIYGGSELGEITGDTNVEIKGGAIGNCIFGGSEGIEAKYTENGVTYKKTTARIGGSTNLTITDGTYFTDEHAAKISSDSKIKLTPAERTFNIYGGGYKNCVINGSTNVKITKSLLTSYKCLIEPDPVDPTKKRSFEACVNDRTYRKFSVYGAGRGELTDIVGNANLTVNIEGGASVPSVKPVDVANNQQFFMIAGGGMAGHVWGNTNVNLDGNVFARRIYGGGMYGNVLGSTNMYVRRGSYYGVFGGGLLGNVKGPDDGEHAANLQIGTRIGEILLDGSTATAATAAEANRNLYIYENVYGGNDVSGCTGYETTDKLWNDGNLSDFLVENEEFDMPEEVVQHHYLFEHWERFNQYGKPYYRHLIRASENKGVNMKICGGKILGDVFGAGNGNHTGYYVPNSAVSEHYNAGGITRMMFYEGLPYHYRVNKKDKNSYEGTPWYDEESGKYYTDNTKETLSTLKSVLDPEIRKDYGLYEYRPRVGKVVMHIGGNSESDRVEIGGDVFGGGHACTIGKYDPSRDVLTDPLRFEGGGSLKMNFGSHVTVKDAVYMGSRGRIIGEQTVLVKPADDTDKIYETSTLNSDYDYHYFDPNYDNGDGTTGRYQLGFPNTKEGRMRFHAYMQLVNMGATTELTFYDQTDNTESKDVRWGSFYAGGARGSMTKQILPEDDDDYDEDKTKPYEYTLPAGLTVEYRVVGGSEDADITYYDYKSKTGNDAFTEIDPEKPLFTFYGGIVYDSRKADGHHYGGGRVQWHDESYDISNDASRVSDDKMVGDESPRGALTVMKLNVNCQFDPQKAKANNADWKNYKDLADKEGEVEDDGNQYWGGLVYGGCYNSGITNGSVEVTCTNTLLGTVDAGFDVFQDYLAASSLRRNVARVYGGGFGENSTILGNTKVTLDGRFRGFNVFGGGMKGNVTGGTEVNVQGQALVYNAVYGGSMLGDVGKASYSEDHDKDLIAKGTHINLISGGIDRVYGGAFMGDIYGGTHITASDEKAVIAAGETGDAVPIRLMVGTIYGGNDITGTINKDENVKDLQGNTNLANGLTTYITVSEKPSAKKTDANSYYLASESKAEAGKFYAGYPMIGTIYGAGNGNMIDYVKGVTIDRENECYADGKVHIANGDSADYVVFDLKERQLQLPNIDASKIDIKGGTIINVYGGGSMCTAKKEANVVVQYEDTVARAAFVTANGDEMTWGILRLFESLQKSEVTETLGLTAEKPDFTKTDYTRFSHQIYRVFGGNNLMDMDIQPTLDLEKGYIFSVYSGGNFGKMTYCRDNDPSPSAEQPRGLSLTINSHDVHIASVYGGSRVGDIDAGKDFGDNEYGATLNIFDGLIGDVYGGNNVAGNVRNGTNVNIYGAISGNVYGSGNGNYIYVYNHADADEVNDREIIGEKNMITEGYDEDYGGRYFILPKKVAYKEKDGSGNVTNTVYYGSSDEEKILAINSYRPNVEKSFLNIQGTEDSPVFVLGNVYCGGNSSSVLYDPDDLSGGNIRFEIGRYVTLGGVFLGSNGEGLANPFNISNLANLNGIVNMAKLNSIASRPDFTFATPEDVAASPLHFNDKAAYDTSLYPNLLSLYMRAAEVTAIPTNFEIKPTTEEAYIGNFCLGGNYGSMMADKTISLTLPEKLTIFGRIVGGCYHSRVDFKGATSLGGMTKKLGQQRNSDGTLKVDGSGNPVYYTDKVYLKIKSKFRPWRMHYDEEHHVVSLVNDRTDYDGNYISDTEANAAIAAAATAGQDAPSYYYSPDRCNIYGGCYTSGKTVGDIKIDLYSDVLGRYETSAWDSTVKDAQGRYLQVNRDMLMNNVALRRTVFALTGAGYGPQSEVEGNVRLRLMPQVTTGDATTHPSVATIFGGAHDGRHVGNSTTEVRDGMVFSSLYAGSRAAMKYGSSEVIIGYPEYYKCVERGEFTLERADKYSKAITDSEIDNKNYDGTPVIKQKVKFREGDLVPKNVYQQIIAHTAANASCFSAPILETPADEEYSSKWDNIDINIGDNSAMNDLDAPFYGGGGIYGGGHALNNSATTYSGVNTMLAFGEVKNDLGEVVQKNYLKAEDKSYGGNSMVVIGDNPQNALAEETVDANGKHTGYALGAAGETIRDHISIGTGHYVKAKIPANGDKMGKYALIDGKFVHQAAGKLGDPDANGVKQYTGEYYEMECDGGIYGDGRRTFVENFRAVDISGYGYADYTPQYAKLINTFQRIDLLSLTDCCIQLQGAKDFATNAADATTYSVARVGELRLNSTLTGNLVPSDDNVSVTGNLVLDAPRSRNFMAFFSDMYLLGAIYTNTSFDSKYRGADGVEKTSATETYRAEKKKYIKEYEADITIPNESSMSAEEKAEALSEAKTAKVRAFKKRNLGTAPNMIGINNGYTLKIQNAYTLPPANTPGMFGKAAQDKKFYGPIIGVAEVKLLTLAYDEGGGYIYALNKHEGDDTTGLKTDGDNQTFLEETGNFIYPASINTGATDEEPENYIIDDCYPLGYYDAEGEPTDHATTEEAHYWYVQGHHYYYNTTLTAYTYDSDLINFRLKNDDNLIILSGITPDKSESIIVESIVWDEHVTDEGKTYECALTNDLRTSDDKTAGKPDTRSMYQMYLTIDSNTGNSYDLNSTGEDFTGFVAQIPNGNNVYNSDGTTVQTPAYGADANGVVKTNNNYSGADNSPLLGIRLQDTDRGNQSADFYHAHLSDPDNLVIKIKAKDAENNDNWYTINLHVIYLQGPSIEGKVLIENCALPGEYVYANTSEIKTEMDDAFSITAKKWYLYPKIKPDLSKEEYSWDTSVNGRVDISDYLMNTPTGDVNRVELPARYYQNDWKIGYSIEVNGQDFLLDEPEDNSNRLTVHNYHRMSTVAKEVKGTTTYGYDLDLDLVGGALVYIEDDEDFEIFTKYVNYCNGFRSEKADKNKETYDTGERMSGYTYEVRGDVLYQKETGGNEAQVLRAKVLPGYNAKGYITGFRNGRTILGYNDNSDVEYRNVKDPSGAENIRFVLNADITLNSKCQTMKEFRGVLNGNGHTIIAGTAFKGKNLIDKNYGKIYYLGVVSQGGSDDEPVIKDNYGTITNSFYYYYNGSEADTHDYSAATYASLIGENKSETTDDHKYTFAGTIDNCYQNTDQRNADAIAGMRYRSNDSFQNGMVAYNLNQGYLKARYNSMDDGAKVHETMISTEGSTAEHPLVLIDYLYDFYADGDYRYANVNSINHPEGLRSSEDFGVPNYENIFNDYKSRHDSTHKKDTRRWFKLPLKGGESNNAIVKRDDIGNIVYQEGTNEPEMTDEGYLPIFLYDANGNLADHSDFIFFGQQLTTNATHRQYYPKPIDKDNRVYRATGCYGTRTDFAFHFNRDVYAMQPKLTAIDFTGYLDLKDPATGKPIYKRDWQFYVKNRNNTVDDPSNDKFLSNKHYLQPNDITYADVIYRSETDSLIQLVYYPPVLDLPGGEGQKYVHGISSFHVVSNADIAHHDNITKNLLVYTPEIGDGEGQLSAAKNDELFSQLHYTRLQQWGDVDGETDQNDIIGHQLMWVNHTEAGLRPHFHAVNGLFHLVDEQDFNAPIDFMVATDTEAAGISGRAWLKRQPKHFSSRTSSVSDGFIIGKDAWESIALPFTCNRVWAVNSEDYIEKYSRGQITHFYGTDENKGITHHDYWLRGLVSAAPDEDGDDIIAHAGFARPGKKSDNLFSITPDDDDVDSKGYSKEQMRGDYLYDNNWFFEAYKDVNYSIIHNQYASPILFDDYLYLTKNAPYIVAFPGPDYYEFDLKGEFYNTMHATTGCHPQDILYEYAVDADDKDTNYDSDTKNVRIPVTDIYSRVRTTKAESGTLTIKHNATFKLISDSEVTSNMYVLNTASVPNVNVDGQVTTFTPGSVFINCNYFGITEILPFRTYLTVDGASAPARRFIIIGGGEIEDSGDADDPDESDEPGDPDDFGKSDRLTISVVDNNLVIISPDNLTLPLYSVAGQLCRRLDVREGRNVYHELPPGVYVVRGHKFLIGR